MSLRIILGYPSADKSASPTVVYAGHNGSEAQAAKLANTTALRFEEFHHISGIRKNNPNYVPPAVETPAVETVEPAAKKKK